MQKVLRTEIKKAIMTRYFIISIAIGILISMLGLVYNVGLFCGNQRYDGMNPCYEAFTLFNHWIGGEGFSLGSSLYFFCISNPYCNSVWMVLLWRTKKRIYESDDSKNGKTEIFNG